MLLDAYGRPVRAAALTQEVARPGMTGVRQAWTQGVAAGLTPAQLAGLLQSAADGEMGDYLALAEEMEERDPHYAGVLGVRKRVVSGVAPTVAAASDSAADHRIAEAVRAHVAEHDAWPGLVEDLLDALGKGFAVVEIDWARDARAWTPRGFLRRDPRWFSYDRETGRTLRLIDEADPDGLALAPFKFIVHEPKLKSGLPLRGGLARLVAFSWICKAYTVKDWVAFIEAYGLPLRLGRYGPEATPDDVRILLGAVANIGTDAAAVLPKSMEIEFQEVADGAGADVFAALARWVDEQVSKAVLGQTMTADNGSSMAQARVHNDVRLDIAQSDARALTRTLMRDLVKPFVDLNFGVQAAYPRLSIVIPEPDDIAAMVDGVAKLAPLGVRFSAAELRAKLGLRDPGDDEQDVIGGAQPPAQPPAAPPAAAAARLAAPVATAAAAPPDGADIYAGLDAVEAAAALDWERQLAPMVGPVLKLAEEAGDFETFRARLPELLAEMEIGPLVDGLVAALFIARETGNRAENPDEA